MFKKIQLKKGVAQTQGKKGGVQSVECIYVNSCSDCMPEPPCDKEVLLIEDTENPGEWYQIDLLELAKSLTAPVVTKVTK